MKKMLAERKAEERAASKPPPIWEKHTKAVRNRSSGDNHGAGSGGIVTVTAGKATKAAAKKKKGPAGKKDGNGHGPARFSKDKYIEQVGNFEAVAMLDSHLGKLGNVRRKEDARRLERAEGRLDMKLARALQEF